MRRSSSLAGFAGAPRRVGVIGLIAIALVLCAVSSAAAERRYGKRTANMPPGWAWPPTAAMDAAGERCRARLDTLGVRWRKGPKTPKVAAPVVVPAMAFSGVKVVPRHRKPPFVMDCHLALTLAEQAPTLHKLGVRELRFSSIYRDTRVRKNGKKFRSLSRHALGLAIDVWEFVDDQGALHSVLEDYPKGDPLLLAVETKMNESGVFRLLLTPANDPASHDDHFHFEVDVDYIDPAERARIAKERQLRRKRARAAKRERRAKRAKRAKLRRERARERRAKRAKQAKLRRERARERRAKRAKQAKLRRERTRERRAERAKQAKLRRERARERRAKQAKQAKLRRERARERRAKQAPPRRERARERRAKQAPPRRERTNAKPPSNASSDEPDEPDSPAPSE